MPIKFNPFGIAFAPRDERTIQEFVDLGAAFIRFNNRMGEDQPDSRMFDLIERGFGIWLTVSHRDRTNVADTAWFDQTTRGGFPFVVEQAYRSLFRRTIEPIRNKFIEVGKPPEVWFYVQIENEVTPTSYEGEQITEDRIDSFWHGTGEEYKQMLLAAREMTRGMVTQGHAGFSSSTMEGMLVVPPEDTFYRFNSSLLMEMQFDVSDVHLFHTIEKIEPKIRWIRQFYTGPLTASEVGGPDYRLEGVEYTEELQAQELEQRLEMIISPVLAINRAFWVYLRDMNNPGDPLSEHLGLMDTTWRRKPAWDSYKFFIDNYPPG